MVSTSFHALSNSLLNIFTWPVLTPFLLVLTDKGDPTAKVVPFFDNEILAPKKSLS